MYLRPKHQPIDVRDVVDLIEHNRFGILMCNSEQGLLATHLPFIFDAGSGEHGTLLAHLARANPHAQILANAAECLVVFTGPHGYVSASNFPDRTSAPSWNYCAVHCYGRARALGEDMTLTAIERLVNTMERERAKLWRLADLPPGEPARLARNVLAFEIPVERIEAKFKMSQGEKPRNIEASINAFEASNQSDLAALMRRYNAEALEK